MSFRSEQLTYSLDSRDLAALFAARPQDIPFVYFGGLQVDLRDLIRAGWSCRITIKNIGRHRVSFSGPGNSHLLYRLEGGLCNKDPASILCCLGWKGGTASADTLLPASDTPTSAPRVSEYRDFNEEDRLLDICDEIKARLRKRRPTPNVIERAVEFAAAS